jgi:hypothetical protein
MFVLVLRMRHGNVHIIYRKTPEATLVFHGHYRKCDISGSHSGVFEVVCLLGYDAT